MMRKGFTLLEVLIAFAISAFVAAGLFTMFSTVANVRDSSISHSENIVITDALTNLFNKDFRMMQNDTLSIDSATDKKKLKFTTQNSLRFNKSLPAEVSYYIDDDNWLVRRESNTDVLYDMEMRLIPNVTEMESEFYNDNEYKKEVIKNTKLMKIHLVIAGNRSTIFAARVMGGN